MKSNTIASMKNKTRAICLILCVIPITTTKIGECAKNSNLHGSQDLSEGVEKQIKKRDFSSSTKSLRSLSRERVLAQGHAGSANSEENTDGGNIPAQNSATLQNSPIWATRGSNDHQTYSLGNTLLPDPFPTRYSTSEEFYLYPWAPVVQESPEEPDPPEIDPFNPPKYLNWPPVLIHPRNSDGLGDPQAPFSLSWSLEPEPQEPGVADSEFLNLLGEKVFVYHENEEFLEAGVPLDAMEPEPQDPPTIDPWVSFLSRNLSLYEQAIQDARNSHGLNENINSSIGGKPGSNAN